MSEAQARSSSILVMGRSGQLATALMNAAATETGFAIEALGRSEVDISDGRAVAEAIALHRPRVVINAAAYTAVDAAETDRETARLVNEIGARNVAVAAHDAGAVVIHVSTDYVFNGNKASPYLEADPPAPVSVYGVTKLAGERAVAAAAPRHVIARTAWVHSATGRNFVKTMLTLASTREEIRVVDDQIGSPTYAPHLAAALIAMARALDGLPAGDERFGVYNVTDNGETSWAGLAREAFSASVRLGGPAARVIPIPASDYPTPARRPANSRLDGAKLARTFGVNMPSWQAGVHACVAQLRANGQF